MYTILPLALALTAAAAPLASNRGAGKHSSSRGPELLPVAGGTRTISGSRVHEKGIAGGADAINVQERGVAQIAADDNADAMSVQERGMAQIAADNNADATSVQERGVAQIAADNNADAMSVQERGVARITAANGADENTE